MSSVSPLVERVWLNCAEAAHYTGRPENSIRRAAAEERLRSAQAVPRGPRRYRREWLDDWIAGRPLRRAS